ncbi:MAG: response regulator [Candidatus Coproplasma sp.]
MNLKRRIIAIVTAVVIALGIIAAGFFYFNSVNETIYNESSAHLTEIYHQANQSFNRLISNTWSSLHAWEPYLREAEDDNKKVEYIEKLQQEGKFTDFYFINGDGNYMTVDGRSGYLDLKGKLDELVVHKNDVVIYSVVPGKPEIILFAVPAEGTFTFASESHSVVSFSYNTIAISFDNTDLVATLTLQAYEGTAGSYVVRGDGRVLVHNSPESLSEISNFLATLRNSSNLNEQQIAAIENDFQQGKSGDTAVELSGVSYYLVYQKTGVDDWMLLGLVPTSVVNKSMRNLQISSALVISGIALILIVVIGAFIFWRYRHNLEEKDSELKYREELFSILSNNTDDIFIMVNSEDLHVDYISPNIERLVGIPESECRENLRVVDRLVRDKDTVLILDQLEGIRPGEQKDWDREYIHQKTGNERWFHVVALCRNFLKRKKYILFLSDRTKEKEINQTLEGAVAAAQSANRAKSAFLSNMSHDIRTPMNAIIGFTTLAAADVENSEKVKDYLSKILSSGNHLLSLINDILDMSRIESGKISLDESEVNLSDLLHDLKTIIGGQIHAKQLDLFMDVIDVVDEDVYCDKMRINQVLLNLLSNAVKFTPSGGTVSVRVAQLGGAPEGMGRYEIRVKDTGIGMSEEFVNRIFDPFERERSSTVSRIQGTGLGMAITKNIIDMMGGTIEVNSEKNVGTEFIINLTLRLQSEHRTVEKIKELEGLKALVVDDDFNTCDSVTKMLVQVGMRSEWTLSGREAVLRAKQAIELGDGFHAYIIDWRLPDMNGIEVTRRIRSLGDSTPIIILTAYDWQDIEEEALAAGVTAFCSKPMFMSDLRESLLTALGQSKAEKDSSVFAPEDKQSFRDKRVLLVEDNELNREIACELLSGYGFTVDVAENGKQAVDKVYACKDEVYDVVLMDIQMPVMNGYEATRAIRGIADERLANIPVIAMTANAFDEDRKAALSSGMNDFLSKPIDLKELIATLRNIFEK